MKTVVAVGLGLESQLMQSHEGSVCIKGFGSFFTPLMKNYMSK